MISYVVNHRNHVIPIKTDLTGGLFKYLLILKHNLIGPNIFL